MDLLSEFKQIVAVLNQQECSRLLIEFDKASEEKHTFCLKLFKHVDVILVDDDCVDVKLFLFKRPIRFLKYEPVDLVKLASTHCRRLKVRSYRGGVANQVLDIMAKKNALNSIEFVDPVNSFIGERLFNQIIYTSPNLHFCSGGQRVFSHIRSGRDFVSIKSVTALFTKIEQQMKIFLKGKSNKFRCEELVLITRFHENPVMMSYFYNMFKYYKGVPHPDVRSLKVCIEQVIYQHRSSFKDFLADIARVFPNVTFLRVEMKMKVCPDEYFKMNLLCIEIQEAMYKQNFDCEFEVKFHLYLKAFFFNQYVIEEIMSKLVPNYQVVKYGNERKEEYEAVWSRKLEVHTGRKAIRVRYRFHSYTDDITHCSA